VNPSLAKENPHEEHEEHKRLLVSTAFRKRSIDYGREIFCLAHWLAEVQRDPAPVLVKAIWSKSRLLDIWLTYQSPSCPFLNFCTLLLTFGGGFPDSAVQSE